MPDVLCTSCRNKFDMPYDTLHRRKESGLVQEGHRSLDQATVYLGTCDRCERDEALARKAQDRTVEYQMATIRYRAETIREQDVLVTRAEAIHRAVDEQMNPRRESDPGFRHYLIERESTGQDVLSEPPADPDVPEAGLH